jgi:Mg2+ and Co2+ transporter CorA
LIQYTFTKLDKISYKLSKEINEVQESIIEFSKNLKALNKPYILNSYLIFFNAATLGNFNAFRAFMTKNLIYFEESPELYEKVDDIRIDIEQVVQFSSIYLEQVKNLLEQVDMIANNSLNQVLKVVGSISLIVSIPTIIGSFYGMNVALPGGIPATPFSAQWVFFLIMGISFSISFFFWLLFRKLKWL